MILKWIEYRYFFNQFRPKRSCDWTKRSSKTLQNGESDIKLIGWLAVDWTIVSFTSDDSFRDSEKITVFFCNYLTNENILAYLET